MVASLCNVQIFKNNKNDNKVVTETGTELDKIRYTDLYVIGRNWIDALKTGLIGENFHLFPVVKAAEEDEPPNRPPYMKFKDLSLYQSPHSAYKEYIGDKIKCPDANEKLLHRSLLPHVKDGREKMDDSIFRWSCYIQCKTKCGRKKIDDAIFKWSCYIKCKILNALKTVEKSNNNFKQIMRDQDNRAVRPAMVAGGVLAGYMIGGLGGGGILRRLFFTSVGLISTVALIFSEETDETFRNAASFVAKTFLALYNKWCGKETRKNLRKKLVCRDELPEQPPEQEEEEEPPEST